MSDLFLNLWPPNCPKDLSHSKPVPPEFGAASGEEGSNNDEGPFHRRAKIIGILKHDKAGRKVMDLAGHGISEARMSS